MEKLAVVIPVYNEEGAIAEVLTNWVHELRKLNISFSVFAFNDGSKDETFSIIHKKALEFPEIVAINQANQGHGPTILKGYQKAASEGFDWVFQIDGDNEMSPDEFKEIWMKRQNFDFLIGERSNRQSPLPRRIISKISYWTVCLFYGQGIKDVNSPYRLMRLGFFAPIFPSLSQKTFAPNVILSGVACYSKARIFRTSAEFHSRKSGTVSIKKFKLLKAALKSFGQTIQYISLNRGFVKKTLSQKRS